MIQFHSILLLGVSAAGLLVATQRTERSARFFLSSAQKGPLSSNTEKERGGGAEEERKRM